MRYRCCTVLVGLLLVLGGATAALGAGGATELASVASDGARANSESLAPALSADGRYVAFESAADTLVPGDTNGFTDVFVRDRQAGTTERVSVASSGGQADKGSGKAALSADGRYVAFLSDATNLIPGDTSGRADVFVHDRQTGATERVDIAGGGFQANFGSTGIPALSADGRSVAFASFATNLVPGDTNGQLDIFVRDREAGTTERVSVASDGTQANSGSGVFTLALSTDGRFVAFVSDATNLVPNDTNGRGDVFVRDRQAGATERVSVDSDGVQANGASDIHSVALSADGRYVAFLSAATNLVPGDTNSTTDVFVRDRQFGTTERVSVTSGGAQANNGSTDTPALSADGRYVAFASAATNLVPGVDTICEDVFVHDRQTGATERVSVASDGGQANGCSRDPTLSADGRSVAFRSFASNLVPDDTNGTWDVFVHDRLALDTTPPVLTMPAAITAEATGPAGAAVPYTATATDAVDGAVAVACAPASGATFPLGTTTVNCSAGDKAGNTATGSFAVTVRDTTRPTLTVPANMTLDATGPAGAPVTYTATASDTVDPRPAVSCAPPNGGTFAIGATTVVCTATDAAGNRARATFTVTVLGAADQTNNLVALVQTFDLKQGIATSLDAKLDAARSALAAAQAGDRPTACNQLGAFINEVQAQSGKGLTVDQANQLIAAARRTQAVLGCG